MAHVFVFAALLVAAAAFSAAPTESGTILVLSLNAQETSCMDGSSDELAAHFRAVFAANGIDCGYNHDKAQATLASQPDIILINIQEAPAHLYSSGKSDDIRDALLFACGMSFEGADVVGAKKTPQLYTARTNIGGFFSGHFKRYRIVTHHTVANLKGFTQRQYVLYRNLGTAAAIGRKWVDKAQTFNARLDEGAKWLTGVKGVLVTRLNLDSGAKLLLGGAHLPMRSPTTEAERLSQDYGVDLRAEALGDIYDKLGSWQADPMILAGDLNFRVDEAMGEQLTQCINENYRSYFGRWKGNGEPPYVTCRFAPVGNALKFDGAPNSKPKEGKPVGKHDVALMHRVEGGVGAKPSDTLTGDGWYSNKLGYKEPQCPLRAPLDSKGSKDAKAAAEAIKIELRAAAASFQKSPTTIGSYVSKDVRAQSQVKEFVDYAVCVLSALDALVVPPRCANATAAHRASDFCARDRLQRRRCRGPASACCQAPSERTCVAAQSADKPFVAFLPRRLAR